MERVSLRPQLSTRHVLNMADWLDRFSIRLDAKHLATVFVRYVDVDLRVVKKKTLFLDFISGLSHLTVGDQRMTEFLGGKISFVALLSRQRSIVLPDR